MQKWVHPTEISGAKQNFRLQMSNLTRIQPQVSLIIHLLHRWKEVLNIKGVT